MSDPLIVPGVKLHIITRRNFSEDLRRHFAGEVVGVGSEICEVKGHVFVFNAGANEYQKRPQLRIRLFSLADAQHIVNKLPSEVDLEALKYTTLDGRLVVTDGKGFSLDINEFGPTA